MSGHNNEVKETSYEKAAADVANQQWDIYKNELSQYEDNFIDRVGNYNSDSNMADTKSDTDLAYNSSYSQARDNAAANMTASGIDPSSKKFGSAQADLTTNQATSQAQTVNQAQSSEQDKYTAGLQDVVALGSGQKATALAGLSDVASMSASKARSDAETSFNTSAGLKQTVGAAAGAGLRSYQESLKSADPIDSRDLDSISTKQNRLNTYDPFSNTSGFMAT
ncbi:hypothetical protein [Vibrio quintilis]|uniref:Uncharacterized protein n=1 Tax=Vibrio quintilis TaxID=1117707 RepID=A0A1M7YPI0_9VIBR|nr:hypothetical protein [Vibrio quintilis]SHO54416.1 hypothetical protein VQ7734_00130 [Vibrio quintilis]